MDKEKNSPVRKLLERLCDPVLIYTVLIMMSIMYHYRSELTAFYAVAALVIGALVFFIFDFIAKHKIIGSLAYIALAFAFLYGSRMCISMGNRNYPIPFGLWFLTPQDALDYNKWYTFAIFLLFMFFMATVIYYFTKVRYRIFMNFLIFIIPFVIYGKEYEQNPTIFTILLAVGYIVIMIKCRKLADDNVTTVVGRPQIWMSIGSYVLIFASIAAIIPKPTVEADRTKLDEMINADALTDRLVDMLSVFRDTSTNDFNTTLNDESILYLAASREDLRLKTQTFSTYDYSKDSWSVSDNDTVYDYTTEERRWIGGEKPGQIIADISYAAENDAEFAEKYGLEDFSAENMEFPKVQQLNLITYGQRSQFAPVPTLLRGMTYTTSEKNIAKLASGSVFCTEGRFSPYERFSFQYYQDRFFLNEENKRLADLLSRDDYYELLKDCAGSLQKLGSEDADSFSDHYEKTKDFDYYLDYGDNRMIKELADQITQGLTSDIEKAISIERYFSSNGFVYDKSYRKEVGDNAEDFIFTSKTGVCYEFATAMTLLSRAAGLPSRYAEGYSLSEKYDSEQMSTNYVIKVKEAHAFPEVYIRGFGWMSFEPTLSDTSEEAGQTQDTASGNLSIAGIFMLIFGILLILGIRFYPMIYHKFFLMKLDRSDPDKVVLLTMRRICRLFRIDPTLTSHEAAESITSLTGVRMYELAEIFDHVAYGDLSAGKEDSDKAKETYVLLYEANREMKKIKNRRKKKETPET